REASDARIIGSRSDDGVRKGTAQICSGLVAAKISDGITSAQKVVGNNVKVVAKRCPIREGNRLRTRHNRARGGINDGDACEVGVPGIGNSAPVSDRAAIRKTRKISPVATCLRINALL